MAKNKAQVLYQLATWLDACMKHIQTHDSQVSNEAPRQVASDLLHHRGVAVLLCALTGGWPLVMGKKRSKGDSTNRCFFWLCQGS